VFWGWFVCAAGLATMRAAIDRGDLDEASRQGMLAGPVIVEQALGSKDRSAQLAGIVAAPTVAGREELLVPLAKVAGGPDRRTALPAARAALAIARELSARIDLPDDLAPDDIATWRQLYVDLARDRDRWIELRVIALDVGVALDRSAGGGHALGADLAAAFGDSDPAFRRAAIAVVPAPVPSALRAPLATAVIKDTDADVALAAAAVLCADLATDPPQPILDVLGGPGIERIRSLAASPGSAAAIRDAKRCLR
jgi:hypothetical protein